MKRQGGGGVLFWENLTSQMEIALFAESFAVFGSKQSLSVRPCEEWVGPARSGPLTPLRRGLGLCRSGSGQPCHGGVLSAAGLGGLLPDLPLVWTPCVQVSGVRSFIQRSLFTQQPGHTPPTPSCQATMAMGAV